jgi:Uma2 family endonuclease
MSTTPVRTKRWSRFEYERLVDLGAFHPGDRVELVAGELLVREPQGSPHATGVRAVEEALRAALGPGWEVRTQMPVALDDESEPEPDVIVAPGSFRDYRHAHPSRPVVLVEVSESSLDYDREDKGSLYARAHVPEYWIANLAERVLEVYREGGPDVRAVHGWAYRTKQTLGPDACITPLAAPAARIRVADLLP